MSTANLSMLNALQQGLQKSVAETTQKPQPMLGQGLAQAASTARTGKVLAPGTGPAQSNLQEKQAQTQAQTQARQIQTQAQTQAVELGRQAQTQETQLTAQELDQKEKFLNQAQDHSQKVGTILSQFNQEGRQLDLKRDGAKLEQVGFLMRLSDDKYLNDLQTEGQKARLEDDYNFKENLQKAIYKDELELLNSDMDFRRLLNADDRTFREQLGNISLDQALALSNTQAATKASSQIWSGVSSLVTGGAQVIAGGGLGGTTK